MRPTLTRDERRRTDPHRGRLRTTRASTPTGQILTILSGLMLGMFLGALDQTIVSTSIRTIADDLNGLSVQAWVTTAYLITATITTPIYGKLGDNYGRKKLFMFAITVFIIGSALCSFATSMPQLAAFRAFQGLGAGGLFTSGARDHRRHRARRASGPATPATSWPCSDVERARPAESAGSSPAQATLLGIAGWRWVFLVNVADSASSRCWSSTAPCTTSAHTPRHRPHRLVGRHSPSVVALGAAADGRRAGPAVGLGTRRRLDRLLRRRLTGRRFVLAEAGDGRRGA